MANGAFCCWAVIFPIAIYLKLWYIHYTKHCFEMNGLPFNDV